MSRVKPLKIIFGLEIHIIASAPVIKSISKWPPSTSPESKEQFQKAEQNSINNEYSKIQSRLNELLNMRLDKSITQDEYDKKATELKQRQYELTERLKKITEADENYSITLITLLNLYSKAPELFESSKVKQKRQLINFLLSNLKLRGKNFWYTLNKPFDVLLNLDYRSRWLSMSVWTISRSNLESLSISV